VQSFGNSYVGGNAVIGVGSAGTSIFWDTAAPGPQGGGVIVTNVICVETSVVLANGANEDVKIPAPLTPASTNTLVRIDGPTGAYSIGGIVVAGGNRGGMMVTLWSAVSATLTVNCADAGSQAANRIYNSTGAPVVIGGTFSNVTLQYASAIPGWLIID
jgi:hypothetical protein